MYYEYFDDEPPPKAPSRRELQVIALAAQGKTVTNIAHDLGLSQRTIKNHKTRLFRKLGVQSTGQAIADLMERDLLDMQAPSIAGIQIDTAKRIVMVEGIVIDPPLSRPQYDLLQAMYLAKGDAFSRAEIGYLVSDKELSLDAVMALVRRLRERIGKQRIVTIHGYGYRLAQNFELTDGPTG